MTLVANGTTYNLLGRARDHAAAIALMRHHSAAWVRIVPLRRGFLVFRVSS